MDTSDSDLGETAYWGGPEPDPDAGKPPIMCLVPPVVPVIDDEERERQLRFAEYHGPQVSDPKLRRKIEAEAAEHRRALGRPPASAKVSRDVSVSYPPSDLR